MRLGVFGGTFDPVHLAHLIAAERLREEARLDRVLFVPSSTPPHRGAPHASAAHRLAMVEAAVSAHPGFEACDLEVRRGGRSYSVDTLRELARLHPGARLEFILGLDAFAEISSWREAEALFGLAGFLVMPRPGHEETDLVSCLPAGLRAGARRSSSSVWLLEGGGVITLAEVPRLEISASDIRRRLAAGRSVRYLVPEAVRLYIEREGLYRSSAEEPAQTTR